MAFGQTDIVANNAAISMRHRPFLKIKLEGPLPEPQFCASFRGQFVRFAG
jgi:hypothetical protein